METPHQTIVIEFIESTEMPLLSTRSNTLNNKKNVHIWSAGGVIVRTHRDVYEVLLCHRKLGALWALPKGTPKMHESPVYTAIREAREETGINVKVIQKLCTTNYTFSRLIYGQKGNKIVKNKKPIIYKKTVYWFLMRDNGGNIENHDDEFDKVNWISYFEAKNLLTHKNESKVLEKAFSIYMGNPPKN